MKTTECGSPPPPKSHFKAKWCWSVTNSCLFYVWRLQLYGRIYTLAVHSCWLVEIQYSFVISSAPCKLFSLTYPSPVPLSPFCPLPPVDLIFYISIYPLSPPPLDCHWLIYTHHATSTPRNQPSQNPYHRNSLHLVRIRSLIAPPNVIIDNTKHNSIELFELS